MAFIEENENGLVYMRSTLIGARHAFTTRFGGVSGGDFATLNLGSNRGDDPACVRENYRRVCALFGVGIDDAAVTNQVHKNEVRIVTAEKGLPIFCFSADCVPALLWDGEHGVAGAIHCGWRSSVSDILFNALEAMRSLGAEPGSVRAAFGPAIGRCCFETDDDVPEAITAWLGGDDEGLFDRRADGKTMVDLRAANARRLVQLGVPAENIDVSGECTCCLHDKYWSHRYTRGIHRGSQASGILLD